MKKIYIVLATLVLTFASCSMDITPEGEILDTEALNSVSDYESFTNGLYAQARSITSGDYVVLTDIQLDDFHAVVGNGNRRMDFYNGSFNPNTGEIGSIYGGYYSFIAQTNFFISKVEEKLKDTSLTTENLGALNKYAATAHFFRAFCYNSLADRFCESYKNAADIDAAGKGLSLQLTYAPTSDNSKYPGRSSLRATYAQILADIDKAFEEMTLSEKLLEEAPSANSNYINSDIIKALKARVCLAMGNDNDAYTIAKEIIGTYRYPLTSGTAFRDMWKTDKGSEVMWQVQADFTYHGSATGTAFASNTNPSDYIPTNETLYLLIGSGNDVRFTSWVQTNVLMSTDGGDALACRFMKYPGNPELYASTAKTNFVNKAKPFRSAELYLIASEAAYNLGEEAMSKYYLKEIKSKRIPQYQSSALAAITGDELLSAIQQERHSELMGEGFRLADLKRWKKGFTRGEIWQGCEDIVVSNYVNLHYEADDHRFVWPIPQHEIDSNPQLKGQQNPGY